MPQDRFHLQIHQRAQRIPQIAVIAHIHRHLSDRDRAFDTDRDMIGVIRYPNRHLLPSLKHRPFDQQRSELNRPEFGVFSPNGLLSQITDVKVIYLAVEEHIEWNLVTDLMVVEVDIAGIEDGAQYILDTVRDFVNAGTRDRGTRGLDKGNVLFCLITAFVDVPYELIRLKGLGIDIGFVSVPHPKEFVFERIGLARSYYMIDILVIEFLKCRS